MVLRNRFIGVQQLIREKNYMGCVTLIRAITPLPKRVSVKIMKNYVRDFFLRRSIIPATTLSKSFSSKTLRSLV
jgi:hypothetical protein